MTQAHFDDLAFLDQEPDYLYIRLDMFARIGLLLSTFNTKMLFYR